MDAMTGRLDNKHNMENDIVFANAFMRRRYGRDNTPTMLVEILDWIDLLMRGLGFRWD